jgi:hypothetical protein
MTQPAPCPASQKGDDMNTQIQTPDMDGKFEKALTVIVGLLNDGKRE